MKSMVALELIIKDLQARTKVAKAQLFKHEIGEEKLTLLAKSSAENSLDRHMPLLDGYIKLLKQFEKFEKLDCYEHRRLRAAVERKKYYKFNQIQNRSPEIKIRFRENDEKIEASMIIDELPEEVIFTNNELYEMSFKNLESYLEFNKDAPAELIKIQNEFNSLISKYTDENIKSLELLNYMIPIVIFHFHIFNKNMIKGEFIKENEELFSKYHDWWIEELWESHLAYLSLSQWKSNISVLCVENDNRKAWEIIFNNWVFIKTLINEKSQLAFEYQYIFDSLLKKYVNLDSELNIDIINDSKNKIINSELSEDYVPLEGAHKITTNYLTYKESNKDIFQEMEE